MSALPNDIRFRGEKIWTQKDNKVAGYLYQGVYYQEYTSGYHTMQHGNSKGMDVSIYKNLLPRCKIWTIIDKLSGQAMSMPFKHIAVLLEYKKIKDQEYKGFGRQIFVPLEYFTRDGKGKLPDMQKAML